jgi:hypothetical protein
MIHRYRVPLFANQSLLCSSHVLAHSCASLPIKCKCSAHLGLSSTVTALVVYQAWLCPQVWCCLIHSWRILSWILLRIILWLVVCFMPTPIMIVNQSWTCLKLKQYSSSICYHQSSWKLSSHLGMHLIACSTKAHGCMLNVLLNRFLSALLIRLWKEMSWPYQWCCFYHPYSYGEVHIWLQNKLSHSQSSWLVPFPTFIQCSYVITSVDNHVSKDDNMRLSFKCSIVPQSVLVVCIFFPFNYIHSCILINH